MNRNSRMVMIRMFRATGSCVHGEHQYCNVCQVTASNEWNWAVITRGKTIIQSPNTSIHCFWQKQNSLFLNIRFLEKYYRKTKYMHFHIEEKGTDHVILLLIRQEEDYITPPPPSLSLDMRKKIKIKSYQASLRL